MDCWSDQVLPSDATVVYTPPDVIAHGGHARSSSNIVKSSNNINVELPHPDAALTTAAEVCAVVEAVLDAANVTRRKDRNSWIGKPIDRSRLVTVSRYVVCVLIGTLPCKTHTLAIAVHSNTDKVYSIVRVHCQHVVLTRRFRNVACAFPVDSMEWQQRVCLAATSR